MKRLETTIGTYLMLLVSVASIAQTDTQHDDWQQFEQALRHVAVTNQDSVTAVQRAIAQFGRGSEKWRCAFMISKFVIERPLAESRLDATLWDNEHFSNNSLWKDTLRRILQGVADPTVVESQASGFGALATSIELGRRPSQEDVNGAINLIRLCRIQTRLRTRLQSQIKTPGLVQYLISPPVQELEFCFRKYSVDMGAAHLTLELNKRLHTLGSDIAAVLYMSVSSNDRPRKLFFLLLEDAEQEFETPRSLFATLSGSPKPSRPQWVVTGNVLTGHSIDTIHPFKGATFVGDRGITLIAADRIADGVRAFFFHPRFGERILPHHSGLAHLSTMAYQQVTRSYESRGRESGKDEAVLMTTGQLAHTKIHELTHQSIGEFFPIPGIVFNELPFELAGAESAYEQAEELLAELEANAWIVENRNTPLALAMICEEIEYFWNEPPQGDWLVTDAQAFAAAVFIRSVRTQDDRLIIDFENARRLIHKLEQYLKQYFETFALEQLHPIAADFLDPDGTEKTKQEKDRFIRAHVEHQKMLMDKAPGHMGDYKLTLEVYANLFSRIVEANRPELELARQGSVELVPQLHRDLAKLLGFDGKGTNQFNDFLVGDLSPSN